LFTLLRLFVIHTPGQHRSFADAEDYARGQVTLKLAPAALPDPRAEAPDGLLVEAWLLVVNQQGLCSKGASLVDWAADVQAAMALCEEDTSIGGTGHDTVRPLLTKLILQRPPMREAIGTPG
jgi:hypothetical protein